MHQKFLLFCLLGVILLEASAAGRRSGRGGGNQRRPQNDYEENAYDEESCEEDGYGPSEPRVGALRESEKRRDVAPDDDDGVIDDPTDDDYLRYENPRENGICLLQRGKCPNGDWKMFQRKNETVCLKLFASPHTVDRLTANKVCRQSSNARLMMLDNHAEREWLWNLPVHNNTFPHILLAGYRNRKCKVDPYLEACKVKLDSFVNEDGTADPTYAFSHFTGGPYNVHHDGFSLDDCAMLHYYVAITEMNVVVRDFKCRDYHLFLCGVTVM